MLIEGTATSTSRTFTVSLPGVPVWTAKRRQNWGVAEDIRSKTRRALDMVVADAIDNGKETPWFGRVAVEVMVHQGLNRGEWVVRVREQQ